MKLHPMAAALTMGLFSAVVLFLWTLVSAYTGYGAEILELVETVYPWYTVSYLGALWGLVLAFLDGFIGVYVIIWIYNFFVKKLGKK